MSLPKNPQVFAEFLTLINECYQLDDTQLSEIKNTYQNNDYDDGFGLFRLLEQNFDCHFDDWKFYSEDLCAYISERINQEFYIDDEEVLGNIEVIINRLESESEYSLLGLESGSDDINIWLIKKSDKPRLLTLANELGLMAY